MKNYEEPKIQIETFDIEDITTSMPDYDMGDGNWMGGVTIG